MYTPKQEVFTAKVVETGKEFVQDSNRDQIFLVVKVSNSIGKTVETRRFGYDLDTSEDEIKTDLDKFIQNYTNEYRFGLKQKVEDIAHEQADEVIDSLKGLELK